jgi:hypothetical protein
MSRMIILAEITVWGLKSRGISDKTLFAYSPIFNNHKRLLKKILKKYKNTV